MKKYGTIYDLPKKPAVYALYGGREGKQYVAYIGSAKSLRTRIIQHLVTRDSSVNARTAAAILNPDAITGVRWWTCKDFGGEDEALIRLLAAELVALNIKKPVLSSRVCPRHEADNLSKQTEFKGRMEALFDDKNADDYLPVHNLGFVLNEIEALAAEIDNFRARFGKAESKLAEHGRAGRDHSLTTSA
ncbi:MAG TPA: hypothetical protein VH369_14145 [Bryobacteraceae bacterium]|jgi:hypothetical protein